MRSIVSMALCAALIASVAHAEDQLSPDQYAMAESMARQCAELAVMSECFSEVRQFPSAFRARESFLDAVRLFGPSADQVDRLDRFYQWSEAGIRMRPLCKPGAFTSTKATEAWAERLERGIKAACQP